MVHNHRLFQSLLLLKLIRPKALYCNAFYHVRVTKMHISLPTLRIAVLVIGVREDKLFFSVQIQSHHEQYLLAQFLVHIHWKKPGIKSWTLPWSDSFHCLYHSSSSCIVVRVHGIAWIKGNN